MLETEPTAVPGTGTNGFATPRGVGELTEPAQGIIDACSTLGCLENLLGTFTRKDMNALEQKADNLQNDKRQEFDGDTFIVKGTFTSKPHIVQGVPHLLGGHSCDK